MDDWRYVDDAGRMIVDNYPPGYLEDPAVWWRKLAKEHIEIYSSVKALLDLGGSAFWHYHSPGRSAEPRILVDPPFCCDAPMYAGFTGWYCRVNRTRVSYTKEV